MKKHIKFDVRFLAVALTLGLAIGGYIGVAMSTSDTAIEETAQKVAKLKAAYSWERDDWEELKRLRAIEWDKTQPTTTYIFIGKEEKLAAYTRGFEKGYEKGRTAAK